MNTRFLLSIVLVLSVMLVVSGCEKTPTAPLTSVGHSSAGIYIVNEGSFMQSTASLSYYDFTTDSVYADVFRAANGRGLGDVANDMKIMDGLGYIVVNNSDRIEVIDVGTNKSAGTISFRSGKNPGFIALIDGTHGFCANYDGTISLFNPSGLSVTADSIGKVQFPGGILSTKGKVYVSDAGYGGYPRSISIFDAQTGAFHGTVGVGNGPGQMDIGADGKVYVICSGINDYFNPQNNTNGGLYVIDPASDAVIDSVQILGNPADIAIDGSGIIYTRGESGVTKIVNTGDNLVVQPSFIPITSLYAIATDKTRQLLCVTSLTNSGGNGELHLYSLNGAGEKTIAVGIFPGTIVVKQ